VGPRAGLGAEEKRKISYPRDLYSSGMLRSVHWYFVTAVSGQTIGTIFKGLAVQDFFFGHGEGDMVCHSGDCCLVSGS